MKRINLQLVKKYVNKNIERFHESKINTLKDLELKKILKKKNPYLFRAKNINAVSDLIKGILDAHLSSSEEGLFGGFLEDLAIFIAEKTCSGHKSSASGIDLEFKNNDIHHLISIKSGPNWGNSAQQKKQEENFKNAVAILKQSHHMLNVQPVLGICYGKTKTRYLRGYRKMVGQNFWYLISENENLYTDIIEPLGYKAKKHNDKFDKQKDDLVNKFSKEFTDEFCEDGAIDWKKFVKFNSGNLDLIE